MTRINESTRLDPRWPETRIKIGPWGCPSDTIEAYQACMELRIRRRGWCQVVYTAKPYRATEEGEAVFRWCSDFWALGEGHYEADVVVNGRACLVIGLHVPHCRHMLLGIKSDGYQQACGTCGPAAPECMPAQIDPVPQINVPEGVTCDANECG